MQAGAGACGWGTLDASRGEGGVSSAQHSTARLHSAAAIHANMPLSVLHRRCAMQAGGWKGVPSSCATRLPTLRPLLGSTAPPFVSNILSLLPAPPLLSHADEQLEEVLSCTARLEKYPDPKPRRNATAAGAAAAAATGAGAGAAANATDAAEAAGAAAGAAAAADAAEAAAEAAAAGQGEEEEEEEEEPGAPCSWLKGVRQQRGSPLYYTLHRALHSRK